MVSRRYAKISHTIYRIFYRVNRVLNIMMLRKYLKKKKTQKLIIKEKDF